MLEYLTYATFILSVGLSVIGILLSTRLRKEFQSGLPAALIYFQVFVFAFGFYGLWGQALIEQFIAGYIREEFLSKTVSVQILLGLPFLILSWYMLIKVCRALVGKSLKQVYTFMFFFVYTLSLITLGYIVFNSNKDSIKLYIYYYIIFSLITQIIAVAILLIKPDRKFRINRKKLYVLAFLLLVSMLVQSTMLLIFKIEAYVALVFVFIFFSGNTILPVYLKYSGILIAFVSSSGFAGGFEEFCKRFEISNREAEIITEICKGLTNKEIADRLFISLQTVKDHTHRIYIKTGTRNRVELINNVKNLNQI